MMDRRQFEKDMALFGMAYGDEDKKDTSGLGGSAMEKWQPISTHPLNEDECLLALFVDGALYIADRGGWVPGEVHEEWDEVEEGISVKIWEEEEEGRWWSNHEIIDEPTHWMPLTSVKAASA